MSENVTWQLVLRAAPHTVFGSLVRAASLEGRVCGVEDFGTVLTYIPTQQNLDLAARMRATVRPCPEGALVSITAAEPVVQRPTALAVQAHSVDTLVRQLRRQFQEENLVPAS
jgi:hypothetical protein